MKNIFNKMIKFIKTKFYYLVNGKFKKQKQADVDNETNATKKTWLNWLKKPILTTTSIFDRVNKSTILREKYYKIMSLLKSKNGFRGEYLARYMISRFAFISESSVDDYGIDFYCGLTEEKTIDGEECVVYKKPFYLQIKTQTKKNLKFDRKPISYDTHEKLETIYGLEIPFFIGYLNLAEQKLDIHSTSPIWYPYMMVGVSQLKKVSLKFRKKDELSNKIELKKGYKTNKNNEAQWQVDLGLPIISIKLSELEEMVIDIENLRKTFSDLIDLEFENLVSKRLGLSYFRWAYEYETNKYDTIKFGYKFVNSGDDSSFNKTTQNMLDAMHPYLVSLALSCKNERDKETYNQIIQITRKITPEIRFKDLIPKFNEIYEDILYDDSDDGDLSNYFPEPTSGMTYGTKLIETEPPTPVFEEQNPNPIYTPRRKRNSKKKH